MASSQEQADQRPKHKAFVSYRRTDCMIESSALVDGLRYRLPEWDIFRDLDSIPPGVDWKERIEKEISNCRVVIVMIGDNWLDKGKDGKRRIDDPKDQLRREIESALQARIRVLPVVVEVHKGARMPTDRDLPDGVERLADINSLELSDKTWSQDLDRLAQVMRDELQERPPSKTDRTDIPKRVTMRWLDDHVPYMERAELNALIELLRQRNWSDGEILDNVLSRAEPELRPPPRKLPGNPKSGQRLKSTLPKRITVNWVEKTAPLLNADELAYLVQELERRGWWPGEIEDNVIAAASPDAL